MRILLLVLVLSCFQGLKVSAQNTKDTTNNVSEKIVVVIKNDGTEFIGKIITQDSREVLIETKELGQVIIPKHEIRSIKQVKEGEIDRFGKYISEEVFATRYFVTTNGLALKKGESYIQWNWYGPDFQIGLSDKFSLGFMTTWVGSPIAATAKYSIHLTEGLNLGVGGILGTLSWARPDQGLMVPFVSLTKGGSRSNISLSTGYGAFFGEGDVDGRFVLSIGSLASISNKLSFVFDSFILPPDGALEQTLLIIIPGLRWRTGTEKSFQFGCGVFAIDGEVAPVPLPMVQWYRKFN